MKTIINKIKNPLVAAMIFIIACMYVMHYNYSNALSEAKAKIEIAERPSLIETQKTELDAMESQWQELQSKIEELKQTTIELEQTKLELEPEIRAKRNEILGIEAK